MTQRHFIHMMGHFLEVSDKIQHTTPNQFDQMICAPTNELLQQLFSLEQDILSVRLVHEAFMERESDKQANKSMSETKVPDIENPTNEIDNVKKVTKDKDKPKKEKQKKEKEMKDSSCDPKKESIEDKPKSIEDKPKSIEDKPKSIEDKPKKEIEKKTTPKTEKTPEKENKDTEKPTIETMEEKTLEPKKDTKKSKQKDGASPGEVEQKHEPLYMKKKAIPKHIKSLVWNKYMGSSNSTATCISCRQATIDCRSFHCGHVLSEAKGGDMTITNLRPVCADCNLSMGTRSMNEFTLEFFGWSVL